MSYYKKIPNFLTLVNLLLGCMALVFLFYDHIELRLATSNGMSERAYFDGKVVLSSLYLGKMHMAALLIFFAVLVDFLDGFAARLLNARSEIGKELDSLSDVVSFGVLPGMVLFQLLAVSFFDSPFAFEIGIFAFMPGFLFTLAAAYRLARFNVVHPEAHFSGLPVPAAALAVMSLPLALFFDEMHISRWLFNPWLLYAFTLLLSWLMISRLTLLNLKFVKGSKDNRPRKILLLLAALLWLGGFFFLHIIFLSIPVIVLIYILFSLTVKKEKNEVHR